MNEIHPALYNPEPINRNGFNPNAQLPYGCRVDHIRAALEDFTNFLGYVNQQLISNSIARFESLLMPANFSSVVSEYVMGSIPKYCPTLVKNRYHNGHPDLIPANTYPGNRMQYAHDGIEVKASRYQRAWQGHNPEDVWLLVVVFEVERFIKRQRGRESEKLLVPFRFLMVIGAQLEKADWRFSGRTVTSRRTITASVTDTGYQKMMSNWIYKDASIRE